MKYISYLSLALAAAALASCSHKEALSYTDQVNVFVGTGGHGHTFPGAVLPHGMVQLSPDTRVVGWDACSGYHHTDSTIYGFSHTHLSGTGVGDYGDILFMPVSGDKSLVTSVNDNHGPDFRSTFSHANEEARPGYYRVLLDNDSIGVELTATMRTGMHRYTYSNPSDARLIIDMDPTIHGHRHPVTEITVLNDSTIEGMKYTEGWSPKHYVYFTAVFSKPFDYELYDDTRLVGADTASVVANTARAVLRFRDVEVDGKVMAKVGISSVDKEGAAKNLAAEAPGWDFEGTVAAADKAWNDMLSRVEVETDDDNARSIFYTSLYHAMMQPCVASDVDGRYRTMNHDIRQDADYTDYTVYSLWDTFRAAHPLYTIVTPSNNQELIRSMLRKYEEGGILPKWELAANETGCMIGYHAVSVIGDAVMKGQCDFDLDQALTACMRSAEYDTTGVTPVMSRSVLHRQLMPRTIKWKNEMGYIPCDSSGSSVAQGLEFAYCDWVISQIADKAGRDDVKELYAQRAQNYRNYYDPTWQKMRGKKADGTWREPFDPRAVYGGSDYVEGNGWQWTWFVPQDVDGLIELMGGKEAFEANLDSLFTIEGLTGDPGAAADVTGLIGQYAHGNEPSHHIPYLYNYVGKPYKSQEVIDHILQNFYTNEPNGLSGNEDVGQMSAWYVLSALGLYDFCPGVPMYELGRPLFDKVTIHLENGNDFVISADNNSAANKYVSSAKLNGVELTEPRIPHSAVMAGGELHFAMTPNRPE